jgi:hypothetical protein
VSRRKIENPGLEQHKESIVQSADMLWINHNSAILLGFTIFVGLAFLLVRDGIKTRDILLLAAVIAVLCAVWLAVRPRQTNLEQGKSVLTQIGAGVPVLLEIQSPY